MIAGAIPNYPYSLAAGRFSIDLLQESGTRTYPTQKQPFYGRNSLALSSAKHGTAERDLHADIYSAGLLQEV